VLIIRVILLVYNSKIARFTESAYFLDPAAQLRPAPLQKNT
jgi:hypothetical protein